MPLPIRRPAHVLALLLLAFAGPARSAFVAARTPGGAAPASRVAMPARADARALRSFDPERAARLGTPCEVHPRVRLVSGWVPIHYGIVSSFPGASGPERERFPNARLGLAGGCVMGPRYGEVAYCPECRRGLRRELKRQAGPQPPRPHAR